MGRFASASAFVVMLIVVLGSAGCGQRFDDPGVARAPSQAELASESLTAVEQAGSAHVVLDAQGGSVAGTKGRLGIHFEGDVSPSALVGSGEVDFPGGSLDAEVRIDSHDAYVRFLGTWYHAGSGFAEALAAAETQQGDLLGELATPAGVGRTFEELFAGDISQGPDVDGDATWEFDGRLRASTLADYVEKYGKVHLTANDRAAFEKVAETSRFVLVVGQDDHLPRKVELTLDPPKDLHFDSEAIGSSDGRFAVSASFSDFGEDVSFNAPKGAKPLDQLFGQLFGEMG
jgi:hypothetical protein